MIKLYESEFKIVYCGFDYDMIKTHINSSPTKILSVYDENIENVQKLIDCDSNHLAFYLIPKHTSNEFIIETNKIIDENIKQVNPWGYKYNGLIRSAITETDENGNIISLNENSKVKWVEPKRYSDYQTNKDETIDLTQEELKNINWCKFKIIVPTIEDKNELMNTLKHLHDDGFENDLITLNQLAHEYLKGENIIVNEELFNKL